MLRRRDATEAAGNELGSIRGTVTVASAAAFPVPDTSERPDGRRQTAYDATGIP